MSFCPLKIKLGRATILKEYPQKVDALFLQLGIRLRDCKLKPSRSSTVSVLSFHPADFDYQYPIGSARSIRQAC